MGLKRRWGEGSVDCQVTVRIIEEGGNIEY